MILWWVFNTTVSVIAGSGSFSNASLKGNYAYEIVGIDITDNVPFREAGALLRMAAATSPAGKTILPREVHSSTMS